jgi:hypothetical protein
MSHDPLHEKTIQTHGSVNTEPHEGHGGTSYEGLDASVKLVIYSLVTIALILVVSFGIVIPIHRVLREANPEGPLPSPLSPSRVIPPEPRLQVHPWETFPDMLEKQEAILQSGGKDENGHVHIPIAQAMNSVVPTLNVRPNSVAGLTIPGGQGRTFAGSLASLPPNYQPPTIQGEIRKNAQPKSSR